MARDTKEAIVETAISLFNEQTVAAVSTNHIARDLGISPGNLYYHFRDKEAIILAIHDRMVGEWDTVWQLPRGRQPTPSDLATILETSFHLHWRFRFFGRELLALMTRDPELRERYRSSLIT
jgi:AcrR family transcriptional regulator